MKYYAVDYPHSNWSAMFLAESSKRTELRYHMAQNSGQQLDSSVGVPQFLLMTKRTWFPSAINEQASFRAKYPFGKRLHEPEGGKEFAPILKWGSIRMVEQEIAHPPQYKQYLIVSEQVKQRIEKFHLPEHGFYLIEVEHEVTGEKRNYYVLYLNGDLLTYAKYCNFSFMEFSILDEEDKPLKKYEPGTFSDFAEFLLVVKAQVEQFRSNDIGCTAESEYYCFNEDYDLIYTPNGRFMSERLRAALIDEVGVDFTYEEVSTPIANGLKSEEEFQAFLQTIPKKD